MIRALALTGLAMALCSAPIAAQPAVQEDVAARAALGAFGRCVAAEEPEESARVMGLDFTTARYRTALRLLADEARRDCADDAVGSGNALRSANLLMAGVIAEGLLGRHAEPLNVRLARAAQAGVPTYSPTDAIAQCLARSLPDQTARLFASGPASAQEAATAGELQAATPACARVTGTDIRMEASVPALRAMLATATFRLLNTGESDHG